MNIKPYVNLAKRTGKKLLVKTRKNSPQILLITGIFGFAATNIISSQRSRKLDPIIEEANEELESIRESEEYDNKKIIFTYVKTGYRICRLYFPAIVVGGISIGCFVASNGILMDRNGTLAAAYTAIDASFKEYRERVKNDIGEEKDKKYRYGITEKKINVLETDPETGEVKKVKKKVKMSAANTNEYVRIFDELNPNWKNSSEYNVLFLRSQENYMNTLLRINKYLFLNDVYDALGFPRTKIGQVVGWIYDDNDPKRNSYVSFGMYDINRDCVSDFINGYESSVILDFNVDGYILDDIK